MKNLYKGILIVLGIIAALLVLAWIFKAPFLSYYLSKKLKVPVSLHSLKFSKGQMVISDLEIKNPLKYQERTAFKAVKIVARYKKENLPGKIDSVEVTDALMNINCKNPLCTKNNWTDIIDGISQKEEKKPKQKVEIRRLYFNALTIDAEDVKLFPGKKDRLVLRNLEFTNLSNETGFPMQQLIAAIFRSAGLKDILKDILQKPSVFEDVIKSIQGDKFD